MMCLKNFRFLSAVCLALATLVVAKPAGVDDVIVLDITEPTVVDSPTTVTDVPETTTNSDEADFPTEMSIKVSISRQHGTSEEIKMSTYKVEVVPSPLSVLGEGPHWDIERQCLYYNDIYGGSIHRYVYAEDKTYNATIDGIPVISFVIPVKGNDRHFILGDGKKISLVDWDGVSAKAELVRTVGEVEFDMENNRWNDAKVDPFGRFYGGTMRLEACGDIFDAALGTFYRYSNSSGFTPLKSKIGVSNGLAWNATTNKFYYIDSCTLDVKEFDYDPKTGGISNERVVIDFRVNGDKPKFVPDGMTIDSEGNLYVATFGGNSVFKIDPKSGKILLDIKLPAEQVTSAAFGGPNLDILYVTTAAKEFKSKQPPPAGSLFKVTGLGVTGTKMNRVDLSL